jgi:stage II sporulation protein R
MIKAGFFMKIYKLFIPIFMILTLALGLIQPIIETGESINSKVFRLHILANSDMPQDQSIKLKVRDYMLNDFADVFIGETLEENIRIARQNINNINSRISDYLQKSGYNCTVKTEVVKEYFKTRMYDDFTLPAGIYNSLRIEIGRGEGHNWWCIIFPQVCLSCCTQSLKDYMTDDEYRLITSPYTPKFKIIEIYERIKEKSRD